MGPCPYFREARVLCLSHMWEQICNGMNWGGLPPVGAPWIDWPNTHDIPPRLPRVVFHLHCQNKPTVGGLESKAPAQL